eukprot:184797-Alexandrium_andersonii.AAC.1
MATARVREVSPMCRHDPALSHTPCSKQHAKRCMSRPLAIQPALQGHQGRDSRMQYRCPGR